MCDCDLTDTAPDPQAAEQAEARNWLTRTYAAYDAAERMTLPQLVREYAQLEVEEALNPRRPRAERQRHNAAVRELKRRGAL